MPAKEKSEKAQAKEDAKVEAKAAKEAAAAAAPKEESKADKIETIVQTKRLNKKYGKVATIELKQRDPYLPRATEAKLRVDIKKMRAITPNELAVKYDVRVSAMRRFLAVLVTEGVVECVSSHDRLKVFNPK